MRRNPWFALIVCWLLSLASLSAQPKSANTKSANSKASQGTSAKKAAAASSNSDPASDKCDWKAEYTQYQAAQFEFDDLNLDAASTQFLALSSSCDPNIKAAAAARFVSVHVEMRKWWWQAGRYFPPFRWFHVHYPWDWWIIVIAGIFVLLLEIIVLLVSHYFPGGAVIMTPSPLTEGDKAKALCDFFASQLQDSSIEATRRVSRGGDGLQVSATTFLAIPSDTAKTLGESLPTIKGVDLNAFVKFFFYLLRYLGWRVESQVAFCPSIKADGGTAAAPARIVAFATVRFAWKVKGDTLLVDLPVDDEYDIHDAAFALAILIMGNHPPKKKGAVDFSDAKSFRLFMQGLGSLLLYEAEAGKAHPRKCNLDHWMNDTLTRLRKCVAQFPGDRLPRFAFGIALAMRNQEVYVSRLQQVQLNSACLAIGRGLAFSDLTRDPGNAAAADDLTQRFYDEAEIASPFDELESAPWPLLDEACRTFGSLTDDHRLKARAIYNLALAYARLGAANCARGWHTLDPECLQVSGVLALPPSEEKETPAQTEARESEHAALLLQFECLRESLNVRSIKTEIADPQKHVHRRPKAHGKQQAGATPLHQNPPGNLDCVLSPADKNKFDAAFAAFQAVRDRIRDDNNLHILAFKTDLIADHLTLEGYIYYECAIARFPIGDHLNAEQKLEEAAKSLTAALEIKPNWNPAQIYLAVVRRIQSGLADAYIDFLNSQIEHPQSKPAEPKDEPKPKNGESQKHHGHNHPEQGALHRPTPDKDKDDKDKDDEDEASEHRTWERQLSERQRQKTALSQESENLFAALQGLPWTEPQPDSSAEEAPQKAKSDGAKSKSDDSA